MKKIVQLSILVILLEIAVIGFNFNFSSNRVGTKRLAETTLIDLTPTRIASPTPTIILKPPPQSKKLSGGIQMFQTYNNCGPASLSMALSYFGVDISQKILGDELRPFQNPNGDNDDKSVTLEELTKKAAELGFTTYHRPNGNIELIKQFITYEMPIVVRTTTKPAEDIGHFRIIKGYDDVNRVLIQDDSLQGKNLEYTYDNFYLLWKVFNFEYLVLVPTEKAGVAKAILGENLDEQTAWAIAKDNALSQLSTNPEDIDARFNLSIAYYHLGNYQKSIDEYELIENKLPFRTLWYQIEPILAYYKVGNYEKVIAITDGILENGNRAYSEVYIVRGDIFQLQGNSELALQEYQKAVYYNKNLNVAKEKLEMF